MVMTASFKQNAQLAVPGLGSEMGSVTMLVMYLSATMILLIALKVKWLLDAGII